MTKVFTYWEGHKSGMISLCHKTIERHNSEKFELLTPESVKSLSYLSDYVNDPYFHRLMPAHRADIIRIKHLEANGGVWIDSDFIAMNSFDALIESSYRRHALYYYVDSWQPTNGILIAPGGHTMIQEWSRKIDCVYSNLKRMNIVPTDGDRWCSFGADQLKVVIDNAIDHHANLGWDRVQLISYQDMGRYFMTRAQCHEFRDHTWPGCYGYMLFNTGFPAWFKALSEEEILEGQWLITFLYRVALGLEKF